MSKRVAVLISGGGSNMMTLVNDMVGAHPCRPCVVISNIADAGGIEKAAARGIPTEVVAHSNYPSDRCAFESALLETLQSYAPDIVCLAGFMRVLGSDFVSAFSGRMLNIHPSLLPKYKGLHTHQRAIDAGDTEAGCSVHLVTPDLDGGPVLGQARVPIHADDTADTLAARVLEKEHILYPMVLRRIAEGDFSRIDLS